jgi:hypothetical protein
MMLMTALSRGEEEPEKLLSETLITVVRIMSLLNSRIPNHPPSIVIEWQCKADDAANGAEKKAAMMTN